MENLSLLAKLEKNKQYSDCVWLILLDIALPSMPNPIRIVRNTEPITWKGNEYTPFAFELGDITDDSKSAVPTVELKVSNVTRALQEYLEASKGGVNSIVTLSVVMSSQVSNTIPELEMQFSVTKTSSNIQWVVFTLGIWYPSGTRRPLRRYLTNYCPVKYKDVECGATSTLPGCPKTLTACRERKNAARFGGDASITTGGMYI